MKRIVWGMVAVFLFVVAAPALAGGGAHAAGGSGAKCTQATQVCLNHWAKSKDMPWAGLSYDKTETGGMTVKSVTPNSPAATAGIQPGDVLVAINGAKITDKEAIKKAKSEMKVGSAVQYTISRGGAEQQLAVTMAAMPPEVFASVVGSHMLENHVPTALADAAAESDTKAVKAEKAEKK
jgi:predicted metalloprotease with PDZ domain